MIIIILISNIPPALPPSSPQIYTPPLSLSLSCFDLLARVI